MSPSAGAGAAREPERQRPDDAERLEDVTHVLHGPSGSGAVGRVLYAVYLTAFFALVYGFTVSRALVITSDPAWVRDHLLVPLAGLVALVLGVGLVLVVHETGRRRGPVVPPLPWVDHVVAGPVDRAVTLREWWVVSAIVVVAGCTVVAGVVGGGIWSSGASGPAALVVALVTGPALGVVLAAAWLTGQVGAGAVIDETRPRRRPSRPSTLLRRLHLEQLRAQSIRSTRLGGAVLAGDLRAARLEAATPVRRGRSLRLRSHGPRATVVARDLLGLRRQPGLLVAGFVLTAPGLAGAAWGLGDPEVPVAVVVLSLMATYLGSGLWAEGLRLLGDTLGTPPLSGLAVGTQAVAHTVLPALLLAGCALPVAALVWVGLTDPVVSLPGTVGWLLGLGAVVLAAQWASAFRGRPPESAFVPESGPVMMTFWYARPLALASVSGGLLTARAADDGLAPLGWAGLALLAVGAALWARRSLRTAADDHRL